ncbi:MAG: hypothetical protein HY074_13055 [Deltaproteobacteria bacterium]|nr:hypothetical protein [Deltaproteobacteria bacterium]
MALRSYFRKSRLHRAGYLKILEQLSAVASQADGLGAALWALPSPVEFKIQNTSPSHGRGVLLDVWRVYRTEWLESLRARCKLEVEQRAFKDCEAHLSRVVAELNRKIRDFETGLERLNKKKRLELAGRFYAQLKQDAEITRAASFLLYRYLITEKSTYLFEADNADLIIEFFSHLAQHASEIIPAQLEGECPKFLAWRIKSLIPSTQQLLSDSVMLPRLYRRTSNGKSVLVGSTPSSDFETVSVRPLHGVWTGIVHQDCLAGEHRNLDNTSPRRWAIGGLAGALTLFLSRDGAYQGVIRLIPMQGPDDQRVVSIDACAPVLGTQVNVEKPKSLFEAWLVALVSNIPETLRRIVMSESTDGDLAQVKQVIWESPCYREGLDLGRSDQFRFSDPKTEQYLRTLPLTQAARFHSDSFVTDMTLHDSGKIRLLELPPHCVW